MSTARIQIQRSTKRLGELLLEAGVVTSEQLESALEEQKHTGKRLAQIFIDRGLLAKGEAGRWLAHQQGYEYVNLTSEPIDLRIARLLPEPVVRRLMALPIREEGREILVAMADPGHPRRRRGLPGHRPPRLAHFHHRGGSGVGVWPTVQRRHEGQQGCRAGGPRRTSGSEHQW
ncbi:MAG: hypothetical protein HYU43_02260 [Armatimonadetes bacterium]|nr:hypothetical protein [Armatimonadota bacterium]